MEPRISIITLGVKDLETSYNFYTALGFPTTYSPAEGIVFFKTGGVCLALYPINALARNISNKYVGYREGFTGVTIAHNTRSRGEVDEILSVAVKSGGTLEKPAEDAFWGGYSGYFADPDGHLWEVAYGDCWQFKADGSLVID